VSALDSGRPIDLGHARQRAVLAVLLLAANYPVSVGQLMDRVWGEAQPRRGREVLYSYLSRLRVALAGPAEVTIQRGRGSYTLVIDPDTVDLHRFRQAATRARAAATPEQALDLFDQALGSWLDSALSDLSSEWLNTATALA
jgi:DNA-binding SARP family transcriptional activator